MRARLKELDRQIKEVNELLEDEIIQRYYPTIPEDVRSRSGDFADRHAGTRHSILLEENALARGASGVSRPVS